MDKSFLDEIKDKRIYREIIFAILHAVKPHEFWEDTDNVKGLFQFVVLGLLTEPKIQKSKKKVRELNYLLDATTIDSMDSVAIEGNFQLIIQAKNDAQESKVEKYFSRNYDLLSNFIQETVSPRVVLGIRTSKDEEECWQEYMGE